MIDYRLAAAVLTALGFAYFIHRAKTPEDLGHDPAQPFSPTSYSNDVMMFARAIAYAEGFYAQGSAPQRAHNPGALKVPGWTGPVTGAEGISVFSSDDAGWEALYRQLDLIVHGRSGIYSLGMSIADMARAWTATDQIPWATNVAARLGVSTSTRLSQVLA
jgi:hypothetical protein